MSQRRRIRKRQGKATTEISNKHGILEREEIDLGEITLEEEPASITIGRKETLMPAQYEPVQVSVMLTLPCKPTPEAIDKAAAWGSRKVDQLIGREKTKV